MASVWYLFAFLFGAIIGSFLNVVIYRYNTGTSLGGRSMCMSCGKDLSWYELIPVASFFIQRKKCANCGSKISWQYPAVELVTGILFLAVFLKIFSFPLSVHAALSLLYLLFVMGLLVVIAVYDWKHKIIPNGLVYAFAAVSFAVSLLDMAVFSGHATNGQYLLLVLAGPFLALPFALIWLLSRGKWMGLGDAKLALGIGWFLGLYAGISAVISAFWIGALFGVTMLFFKGKAFTMKSEIPFGPFLVLGTLLVFFFGFDIFRLSSILLFA